MCPESCVVQCNLSMYEFQIYKKKFITRPDWVEGGLPGSDLIRVFDKHLCSRIDVSNEKRQDDVAGKEAVDDGVDNGDTSSGGWGI